MRLGFFYNRDCSSNLFVMNVQNEEIKKDTMVFLTLAPH
jgi:hypothetical protein